jgi:hypothetical protein
MGYVPYRKSICKVAIALFLMSFCSALLMAQQNQEMEDHVTKIHGTVLNSVTGAPVARALVAMLANQYAMMTNDQGLFEFDIHQQFPKASQNANLNNSMYVEVRKQGFLQSRRTLRVSSSPASASQVKISLVPEALIVGHIDIPGSDGDVKIQCELLRKAMTNGRSQWQPVGQFSTWADGEFRFSELQAGTYKVITHEQMDPATLRAGRGAQLYGYPPMYYTNTTNFSDASEIVVRAGETARLNMAVARKAYYPVHIPVRGVPGNNQMSVKVWPMGSRGPGWSLGYEPGDGAIEGLLPTGNYTVELNAGGPEGAWGSVNFAVKDAPLDGPVLTMAPSATVAINIHSEFANRPPSTIGASPGNPSGMDTQDHVLNVELVSIDEMAGMQRGNGQDVTGSPGSRIFRNVQPGRYVLQVNAFGAYVASIDSGGTDLLHQPLVVGTGSSVPPIEITLRDDGGEIEVMPDDERDVEGQANSESQNNNGNGARVFAVLLPLDEWGSSRNDAGGSRTIRMTQVSPGNYLVLAFDDYPPQDLPFRNREAMQEWISQGQVVHVDPGQHISVHLKLLHSVQSE